MSYHHNPSDRSRQDLLGLEGDVPPPDWQVPNYLVSNNLPLLAPGGGAESMNTNSSWRDQGMDWSLKHYPRDSGAVDATYEDNHDSPQAHTSSTPATTTASPVNDHSLSLLPAPTGLPVYSASGFDLLSIMARVATRPNPTVPLGPVDFSTSFVVVDVRRHDRPIVYASPSFCDLTRYSEAEVVGRNCRFLQSPTGQLERGAVRKFTDPDTVSRFYKSVMSDQEVQASLVNYRKGGEAFINLVTVIPVYGGLLNRTEEQGEVIYHVGFQVDLTAQPGLILEKMRNGTYARNWSSSVSVLVGPMEQTIQPSLMSGPDPSRARPSVPMLSVSTDLQAIIPELESPVSLSADGTNSVSTSLSHLILSHGPDFVHVLSLKGAFLYCAPSVSRVLGLAAGQLINTNIADICHPADLVPLMRELKESSTVSGTSSSPSVPRTVDLLYRAKPHGAREWIWIEARGRLHVEPGKGRKAIVLSGRRRRVPKLSWGALRDANIDPVMGGWITLDPAGTVLSGSKKWTALIGKSLRHSVESHEVPMLMDAILQAARSGVNGMPTQINCTINKHRQTATFYPSGALVIGHLAPSDTQPVFPTSSHQRTEDVFGELSGDKKETSWQYEIQQLKIQNDRLAKEVASLEPRLGTKRYLSD